MDGARLWIALRRLSLLHRYYGRDQQKPLGSTDPLGRCTSQELWFGTMPFGVMSVVSALHLAIQEGNSPIPGGKNRGGPT